MDKVVDERKKYVSVDCMHIAWMEGCVGRRCGIGTRPVQTEKMWNHISAMWAQQQTAVGARIHMNQYWMPLRAAEGQTSE